MKLPELIRDLELAEGVSAEMQDDILLVKGPKGELKRKFLSPAFEVIIENNKISLKSINVTKRKKRMNHTYFAHLNNMVKGVVEGVTYKLKICSGHFPMNVAISGDTLVIKNFLGEKVPRTLKINSNVKIKIQGDLIELSGIDLELVGQTAANIEKKTRRSGFDFNRFQDGIYIIGKAGEKI